MNLEVDYFLYSEFETFQILSDTYNQNEGPLVLQIPIINCEKCIPSYNDEDGNECKIFNCIPNLNYDPSNFYSSIGVEESIKIIYSRNMTFELLSEFYKTAHCNN